MKNNKTAFAVSMAVLWGVSFGSALHSWTLGICLGLMMGIAFDLFDSGEDDSHE